MEALAQRAQRAQQAAREGLTAARRAPAVDRALEAGRAAREAAAPKLSHAREGVHQRITDNPEATARVARALTIAVLHAAAAANPENEKLKKAAPEMGDHVSKAVGKLIARSQRRAAARADAATLDSAEATVTSEAAETGEAPETVATNAATATGPTGPSDTRTPEATPATGPTGPSDARTPEATPAMEAGVADGPGALADGAAGPGAGDLGTGDSAAGDSGAASPAELAASLGVRPPPDPAALYRDGPGSLELVLPLPGELASLPWSSLSRRNRFYVLVAAWALREADGIQLLKGGQFQQAGDAFQECLIRAEHLHTPELVTRSYTDLAELAAAGGDDKAAGEWRAAAARAAAG